MASIKMGKVYVIIAQNGKERTVARAGSGPENTIVFTPIPPGQGCKIEGEVQL